MQVEGASGVKLHTKKVVFVRPCDLVGRGNLRKICEKLD